LWPRGIRVIRRLLPRNLRLNSVWLQRSKSWEPLALRKLYLTR
jgi:hypothetical protein